MLYVYIKFCVIKSVTNRRTLMSNWAEQKQLGQVYWPYFLTESVPRWTSVDATNSCFYEVVIGALFNICSTNITYGVTKLMHFMKPNLHCPRFYCTAELYINRI